MRYRHHAPPSLNFKKMNLRTPSIPLACGPMMNQAFSAREYLRARRPERFSDSTSHTHPVLDRSFLEYHLDTLTSRRQETDFEDFARQLAEREICPNLLPQTGPTGGGDSQVDAETFPVAEVLALGWYRGVGKEAANERWAFAFSAKKKWQDKVRSDVAKIVATDRGYSRAFFISSQFISDKNRAKLEDELSKKHNIGVRILDRTWILDRVFTNGHEALAIAALRIETSARTEVRKGPQDTRREEELAEVEAQIQEALREGRLGVSLVADCLEAADLARSLERPRAEVVGYYSRAQDVADKYGTAHQRLEAAYQIAWTTFFWYEDFGKFAELYGAAERLAKGSRNAHDLELLTNLWQLLHASVHRNELDAATVKYRQRTHTVTEELRRLSQEEERPSTALQAETLLALVQLVRSPANKADPVLRKLQSVISRSKGLIGYPLAPLLELLTEVGPAFQALPAYGELFETMIQIRASSEGEIASARMLLERGWQQLTIERPYEAIRSLGRAFESLSRHESRHDLVRALYFSGFAYQQVGLLWAARGAFLSGASLATNEFWTYSEVTPLQAACYRQMKWIELRLGRIPHVLAWHELDSTIRAVLRRGRADVDESEDEQVFMFDSILGILFLKVNPWQLKHLDRLPNALERLDLHISRVALLYALGYEEEVPEAFLQGEGESRDLYDYFAQWRDQPAVEDLEEPSLGEERKLLLKSRLLGCQIVVETPNIPACVDLGETILAALESFLSTVILEGAIAREPTLSIYIRKSDFAEEPLAFEFADKSGLPFVNVTCGSHPTKGNTFSNQLFELVVSILAHIVLIPGDLETFTTQLVGEAAASRAINYTASFPALSNVLGNAPKLRITQWSGEKDKAYTLKRINRWDHGESRVASEPAVYGTLQNGQKPPAELVNLDRTKHTNVQTVSLIRERLWDKAGWKGTGFFGYEDDATPPAMAIIFSNIQVGKQIFREWQSELRPEDVDHRLRISVIRGIDRNNPMHYRVVIGSNPGAGFSSPDIKLRIFMQRMLEMEPQTDEHLNRFLKSYERAGKFYLAPGYVNVGASLPGIVFDHRIWKRELVVRDAWTIGMHDIDGPGVALTDDPIIPPGVERAPVLELLRARQEQKSKYPGTPFNKGKK